MSCGALPVTTVQAVQVVGLVLGAYLLGAVPMGWLVCRVGFGVNIFEHGSQRSGATNVYRTVGRGAAVIVFVGDTLKGFVPTLLARLLVGDLQLVPLIVAVVATMGHNWSIFIGLRGGRGVATSWGAVMAVAPLAAVIGMPMGVATIAIGRYVSLGSLAGALGFLVGAIAFYALGLGITGFHVTLTAIFVVFLTTQHLDNLQRLFTGRERRLAPWPELIGSRGSGDHGRD